MAVDKRATQDRGPAVLAVTAAMMAVSSVFVFLRFVSRAGIVKRVTTDDYVMLVAWILAFGLSFSICYATKYGLGKHEDDIPDNDRVPLDKLEYVFTALYNPSLMATKTSILVFYLSLAKGQKVFKWTTVGTLVVVNAAGLALSLVNIFQCRPVSSLFKEPKPPYSRCTEITTLYLSSAPVNIITDLLILLLPMPVLKGMSLPQKQKIILYVTFGFGIFVTAVDVVRISYLQQAAVTRLREILNGQHSTNQSQNQQASDFSYFAAYIFLWSAIEVNVGIMCGCVPGLKPLVTKVMPAFIHDAVSAHAEKADSNYTSNTAQMVAEQRVPSMRAPAASCATHDASAADDAASLEFMTTPTMTEFPGSTVGRTQTAMTDASGVSDRDTRVNFMDMADSKGIVYMSARECVRPFIEVTFLFFLWGFAYGLLNSLNSQIQKVARESPTQAIGTHAAYYVGYFCGPLAFGIYVFKHFGFKACYMVGLMIYGTGTLVFWPSAVLTSWPGFLVTNWLIGVGLSILEMAGNPFIALCGPPEHAELRLNLSQGFQGIGTLVSHVLAEKALFTSVLDAPSLIDVQWTYLAISLFTFILACVYYVMKLPEVKDSELEDSAESIYGETLTKLRESHVIWITLGMGVFAQFLYVGAQEAVATSLPDYIAEVSPTSDTVNYQAIGLGLFAASRFVAAGLTFIFSARVQIMLFFVGSIVFSALAMNFSGLTSGAMVICVFFCEGPLFPFIFATPLRGLGRHTRTGSALLAAAISGGAVFQGIQYAVAKTRSPRGTQYSYCVMVAAFAFCALFPLYLWLVPLARIQTSAKPRPDRPRGHSSATIESVVEKAKTIRNHTRRVRFNLFEDGPDKEAGSIDAEPSEPPSPRNPP